MSNELVIDTVDGIERILKKTDDEFWCEEIEEIAQYCVKGLKNNKVNLSSIKVDEEVKKVAAELLKDLKTSNYDKIRDKMVKPAEKNKIIFTMVSSNKTVIGMNPGNLAEGMEGNLAEGMEGLISVEAKNPLTGEVLTTKLES